MRVNEHFANELDKLLRPDDLVWVHDYHLIPLAKALRARGHKNRIGYFLHIPCPPPEVLTALPNHERLMPALCEYDLVGFQTGDDAFNFSRYLTRECGLHSRDFSFAVGRREVQGVDVGDVDLRHRDGAVVVHLLGQLARQLDRLDMGSERATEDALEKRLDFLLDVSKHGHGPRSYLGPSLPSTSAAKSLLRSGPPLTTHRFHPIQETRACLFRECAECVPVRGSLREAPRHHGKRDVHGPSTEHERHRAHRRRSDQRRRQEERRERGDRQVGTAGHERERRSRDRQNRRLEPERRRRQQPLPDRLQHRHGPGAYGL